MSDLMISLLLGMFWFGALAGLRAHIAGTTLVEPWIWAMVSAAAVVSTTIFIDAVARDSASVLQYLAATGTLCPVVALLGAKKPQNRAWQWIVGALWLILSVPALTAVAFRFTQLQLGSIWTGLILILVFLPIGNYLSTRYFFPVVLTSMAQIILLSDCGSIVLGRWSTWINEYAVVSPRATALCFLLLATATARYVTPKRRQRDDTDSCATEIWKEFSQLYGILWSRRIADRTDKILAQAGSPLRLGPAYFYTTEKEGARNPMPVEQLPEQANTTLKNLLRRFVSPQWMASVASHDNE